MTTLTRNARALPILIRRRIRCQPNERADSPPAPVSMARPLTAEGQLLVTENIKLAYKMAWAFHRKSRVPADESIAEACFGLVYAAGLYDSSRGVPFAAFALMVVVNKFKDFSLKTPSGLLTAAVQHLKLLNSEPIHEPNGIDRGFFLQGMQMSDRTQ